MHGLILNTNWEIHVLKVKKVIVVHHRKTLGSPFFYFILRTLKDVRSRFYIAYNYCIINSNSI